MSYSYLSNSYVNLAGREDYMEYLQKCSLFNNTDQVNLVKKLKENGATESFYEKDSYVFEQGELPEKLYILLEGSVAVSNIEEDGKRTIVNIFKERGTVFGEVYVFLEGRDYDYSCVALKDTRVFEIPKKILLRYENWENKDIKIMIRNMLDVLSRKALYLNEKNLILSELTLRQKLIRFFEQNKKDNIVQLKYSREELADYLGTTRPSVSREINKMKNEGLIDINGRTVYILNKGE